MTGCGGVKVVSPEAGNSSQKAEFEKIKTPEDEKVVLNRTKPWIRRQTKR